MKTTITLFLVVLIFSLKSYSQRPSFDSAWRRSLYREFKLVGRLGIDSCYYCYTLLKVDLDKRSMVSAMLFADNADGLMQSAFLDIFSNEKKISPALENETRKAKIKNISLLLPIAITSWGSCPQAINDMVFNDNQYKFKGKYLRGQCLFLEPLILMIDGHANK